MVKAVSSFFGTQIIAGERGKTRFLGRVNRMESKRLAPYKSLLLVLAAIQFCISTAILLLASTNDIAKFPLWFGVVDVVLAVTLIFSTLLLKMAVGTNAARVWQTGYIVMTYLVPILLAAVWFWREGLPLNTFLPGLAWRLYVLFEGLPPGLAILDRRNA